MGREAKRGTIIAVVALAVVVAAVFAAVALAGDAPSTVAPESAPVSGVQGAVEYTPEPASQESPVGGACNGSGSPSCGGAGADGGAACPATGQTGNGATCDKAGAACPAGAAGGCCGQ